MKPNPHPIDTWSRSCLLAVLVGVAIAMPVAGAEASVLAHASAAGRKPAPSKVTMRQIKALKKEMAKLTALGNELVEQVGSLGAKTAAIEGKELPKSLSPSGPAGGALIGSFPTPLLAPNAVRGSNIIDGSVESAEIGDGSVTSADLALGSIGGLSLNSPEVEFAKNGVPVKSNHTESTTVTCPRETRLLSGGAQWGDDGSDTALIASAPDARDPNKTWFVRGRQDVFRSGEEKQNILFAVALCLKE